MERKITVNCGCTCSKLDFVYDNGDGLDELIISHYYASFYNHQQPIWTTIKNRLKMIWCGITGKDYEFYELVFYGEQVKKVKEDLKNFLDSI